MHKLVPGRGRCAEKLHSEVFLSGGNIDSDECPICRRLIALDSDSIYLPFSLLTG